jgi:hypothetical protein
MVNPPVHPRLVDELARLAARGLAAAEARRRIAPLAAQLGVPRPGYTAVLLIVQVSQPPPLPAPGPSVLDSLVLGRMPTERELDETVARARVHIERARARRTR